MPEDQAPVAKLPPPLQPRARTSTPKVAEMRDLAVKPPSSPLAAPPVRPSMSRTPSAIAHSQTMYGKASDGRDLHPPRQKVELDKDELTTKGRKRKRLAKACSACHKNKRRCDGFAPCSNCEFSARPCIYLNAQGEQIPPPRTRDSSATPAAVGSKRSSDDGKTGYPATSERRSSGGSGQGEEWRREYLENNGSPWRGEERRPTFGPLELVDRDLAISYELIDVCLKRTPPYRAVFHEPTFWHRLYLGQVQPFLLDAMYAFGARLSENPAFIGAYPPEVPSHQRGRVFAERGRASLDRIIEARRSWTEEERKADSGTWEETEFIAACMMLSMFFNAIREARIGFFYLDVSLAVLRSSPTGQIPAPPNSRLNLPTAEYFTLTEVRNRTFWLVVICDICSTASGRPRRVTDAELSAVPLPGPELYWSRFGGMAINGREPGRRDSVQVGSGNWHSEEGQVGELGHVVRILIIFSNIMMFANNGNGGLSAEQYEQALKSWALDLPRHLRFDEINLSASVAKINSPIPEVAFNGWAFTYMHAVAECGMFYLQSKHSGAGVAVQRQGQAVDNLTVMIDALGERGREGPLMFFPIMIVTCWTDHVSATSPTAASRALEERLNVWWAELYREWGWERRETLEQGIFPNLASPERDDRPMPRPLAPPSNNPRAYLEAQAQARNFSPRPSADSAASPYMVVTPTESRYPVLPPLRPRDGPVSYTRSPSPQSDEERKRKREQEAEAEREREERQRERAGFTLPPMAFRDRYDKERQESREGSPRPLAPPPKRERERERESARQWPGSALLGIEALVSAAEEHRRGRVEQPSAYA